MALTHKSVLIGGFNVTECPPPYFFTYSWLTQDFLRLKYPCKEEASIIVTKLYGNFTILDHFRYSNKQKSAYFKVLALKV